MRTKTLVIVALIVIAVLALTVVPAFAVKAPPGLHKAPAVGNVNPHVVCARCHVVTTLPPALCARCHTPS